jgi:Transposase DDE domain
MCSLIQLLVTTPQLEQEKHMDTRIVAVYCLCDDMLKALYYKDDVQCQMTAAEVMTTAIIAALDYGGNLEKARKMLQSQGYIPQMLSKSRFNRRWHRNADLFLALFSQLGETWKQLNHNSIYVIDSFPVAVCDNYRIGRCHLYRDEAFRGYQASKRRYFYGLKIHLMITETGQPVEFFLTPGGYSDTSALKLYNYDLPEGAKLTGDKAYNDYDVEDLINEAGISFIPIRKKNSKRPVPPWVHYLRSSYRKLIETTGSLIEQLLPKHIHAVTAKGFELKVATFVLACSVNYLFG